MFTLSYTPNAYRTADNLLPIGQNRYESRPGFFQVVSDNINRAFGWNDACVMEIFGGVYVWHGNIFESIASPIGIPLEAGLRFTGSRFQALQSLGNREERIYVGDGSTVYYLHRNVIEGAEVTGVEVTPETLEILVGTTEPLTAIIEPSWALNKNVTWTSDDEDYVTVDDEGILTAEAVGAAVVTATTEDGSFTDTCEVTVVPFVPVTGVDLVETELTVEINDTIKPEYTVLPENATDTNVYWISDDLTIAAVSVYGTVTGISEGETTVHVYTDENDFTDSCLIKVVLEGEGPETAAIQSTAARPPLVKNTVRPTIKSDVQKPIGPDKFYEAVVFDNEFVDGEDEPYPLPKARFLATWRNRLWAGDGTHIIYHCLNDNPHHWEPLDAIPIQGGEQSEVTGLCPMGNRLIVSTPESLWQIVGDSPYNWEFQSIVHGHGAVNDKCMATDGQRLFYLDRQGVYELGRPDPISEAIEDVFYAPDYDAQILLDARGEYLYVLVTDRLFVYNSYNSDWGEIIPPFQSDYPIKGLVMVGGQPGWYGDRGLWLRGTKYTPDVWMTGTREKVKSRLRTWPVQPNPYGQTALNRTYMSVEGVYQGTATYRVYPDINSAPMGEQTFQAWQSVPPEIVISTDPFQVVYREQSERVYLEVPLEVANNQFEHEIESVGFIRLHSFDPKYQFTRRAAQ